VVDAAVKAITATAFILLPLTHWCDGSLVLHSMGTVSLKWKLSTLPFPNSNGAAPLREFTVIYSYHVVKEC
jgi:hypothetical protein